MGEIVQMRKLQSTETIQAGDWVQLESNRPLEVMKGSRLIGQTVAEAKKEWEGLGFEYYRYIKT